MFSSRALKRTQLKYCVIPRKVNSYIIINGFVVVYFNRDNRAPPVAL